MERAFQIAALAGCGAIAWLAYDRLAPGAACNDELTRKALEQTMRHQLKGDLLGIGESDLRPSALSYEVIEPSRAGLADANCSARWVIRRKRAADDEAPLLTGTVSYQTVQQTNDRTGIVSFWKPDQSNTTS